MQVEFIRRLDKGVGEQRLYGSVEATGAKRKYIVVSAVSCAFDTGEAETYIFPSDSEGNITDWGELDGSFRGGYDHEEALRRGGYELVSTAN